MATQRITPEAFVLRAIPALRQAGYKGIHAVYSGFNGAFKRQFPNLDVQTVTKEMVKDGKVVIIPVKGGVMLYLTADAPSRDSGDSKATAALATILAAK